MLYTDHNLDCDIPPPNTNFLKSSLVYKGTVAWNNMPVNIRESNSLSNFKTS